MGDNDLFKCSPSSIRVILMIGCVLMIIASVYTFGAMIMLDIRASDLEYPNFQVDFWDYMYELFYLVTAIVGLSGACSRNPKYLKLFALFIVIYSVIFLGMTVSFLSFTDWPKQNKQFTELMTNYSKSYEWDAPAYKAPNKATRAWEQVQTWLMCCGLNGPSDWTSGLLHQGGDKLPRSCCMSIWIPAAGNGLCTIGSKDLFDVGCMTQIENHLRKSTTLIVLRLFMYPLSGLLAFILARKSSQAPTVLAYGSKTVATIEP